MQLFLKGRGNKKEFKKDDSIWSFTIVQKADEFSVIYLVTSQLDELFTSGIFKVCGKGFEIDIVHCLELKSSLLPDSSFCRSAKRENNRLPRAMPIRKVVSIAANAYTVFPIKKISSLVQIISYPSATNPETLMAKRMKYLKSYKGARHGTKGTRFYLNTSIAKKNLRLSQDF